MQDMWRPSNALSLLKNQTRTVRPESSKAGRGGRGSLLVSTDPFWWDLNPKRVAIARLPTILAKLKLLFFLFFLRGKIDRSIFFSKEITNAVAVWPSKDV